MHQNLEYNLRILANFHLKTQKYLDFAYTFSKKLVFLEFLIKIILFTLKTYFFYNERCPTFCKNQFFSNIFRFLSVIRQNFEYNLRILANFGVKTPKSTVFAHTFSKNYSFFVFFLNKDYTFYTKNLFFTTKDAQSFVKMSF